MAGLTSAIPGIMWLSAHKNILFVLSGGLMAASTLLWWQQRHAPCPVDPIKAAACERLRGVDGRTTPPLVSLIRARANKSQVTLLEVFRFPGVLVAGAS